MNFPACPNWLYYIVLCCLTGFLLILMMICCVLVVVHSCLVYYAHGIAFLWLDLAITTLFDICNVISQYLNRTFQNCDKKGPPEFIFKDVSVFSLFKTAWATGQSCVCCSYIFPGQPWACGDGRRPGAVQSPEGCKRGTLHWPGIPPTSGEWLSTPITSHAPKCSW